MISAKQTTAFCKWLNANKHQNYSGVCTFADALRIKDQWRIKEAIAYGAGKYTLDRCNQDHYNTYWYPMFGVWAHTVIKGLK